QAARLHEGLIIEARREQWRCAADQRSGVMFEPRPGMLARRAQTVVKDDVRCAAIWLGEAAGLQLHERRGLLRSRRKNPARPVVFEAARDKPHAICEQRRSQRIAGMAFAFLAVEGEAQHAPAVDLATARQAERLRHGSRVGGTSPVLYTARMRWVAVSRMRLNQRRQPALCTQRSGNGPFGVLRLKRYWAQAWSSSAPGSAGRAIYASPP